jgi:hypothetical protein
MNPLAKLLCVSAAIFSAVASERAAATDPPAVAQFHHQVQPLLEHYCYQCHGDGMTNGSVALDDLQSDAEILDRTLWSKVLVNVRSGLMPPRKETQPTTAEVKTLADWIKYGAFAIDPKNPDPGPAICRRLSREEYRNTIRDLLGVAFTNTDALPPDDTNALGNSGDLSSALLEIYTATASNIVEMALPKLENPANRGTTFQRFFPTPAPKGASDRRRYAREILESFMSKAYRRPVDSSTLDRSVDLAEGAYARPGHTFEQGVTGAMVAALTSPPFLFRKAVSEPTRAKTPYPLVDEFSLAYRLSYFLWSSTPDDELLRLAGHGQLRKNLAAQLRRMVNDPRSEALVTNFTGQWLMMGRFYGINPQAVLARDYGKDSQINTPTQMDAAVLRDMARETEMLFSTILRENRSVKEFIECDYTFLNQNLATAYGLTNFAITGPALQRVTLPPDSARGGVLTESDLLLLTSHRDRASATRRGTFVLNDILGWPLAPRPANATDEEVQKFAGFDATARDALKMHLVRPGCNACHARIDPIGLAFENFNALGQWRDQDRGRAIDPAGQLITGESFRNARELKHILVTSRCQDFYRTLAGKMLTYAIGRCLEYYDSETVDQIVQKMDSDDGRFSALLTGIIESAPFQEVRQQAVAAAK